MHAAVGLDLLNRCKKSKFITSFVQNRLGFRLMKMSEKKSRGRPSREFVERVWRLYGSGYVHLKHLDGLLTKNGGQVVVRVINDELERGVVNLVYGLFYRSAEGEYFDVITSRNSMIKTFSTATGAGAFLSSYAEELGERFFSVSVPVLSESQCLVPGQLEREFLDSKRSS